MNFHKVKYRNEIIYSPSSAYDSSTPLLERGVYKVYDSGGLMSGSIPTFEPIKAADNLVNFTSGIFQDIMQEVSVFLSQEIKDKFSEMKICYKTGMILYGPPGTGKTSVAMLCMKEMVEKYNAVCLDATKSSVNFIIHVISILRRLQNSPIILFVDEIDESLYNEEYKWLPFLDGADSVEGLIVIGCTNNIQRIPDRVKNRKSRIKKLFKVDSLPMDVYRAYFNEKLPNKQDIKEEFCYKAEEARLNIDQFKNALMEHYIFCSDIDRAISSVKKYDNV